MAAFRETLPVHPQQHVAECIVGGPELDAEFGIGASAEHYTLCRCGGSKNKPFCDGAHWNIDFDEDK